MNAATRIRASWSGWRRGGVAVVFVVGVGVVAVVAVAGAVVVAGVVGADSRWPEDGTVRGMIPIRYVTDRFGFLHDRTWR